MKGLVLLVVMAVLFDNAGYAQSARTFGKKAITVRLCPVTCVAVNGHGFKAGGKTTILETKRGWGRVSGYLERAKLVASFGDKTPAKPALWVPLSSLVSLKAVTTPKKVAKKRVSVIDRLARLRNVPLPSFRPGGAVATPAAVEAKVVEPSPTVEVPQPVDVAKPIEKKIEVVESQPIQTTETKATGASKVLTWEQLQAKLAAQKAGIQTARKAEATKKVVDAGVALKAQKAAQDAAKANAEEAARKAALKRAAEISREADVARVAEAKRVESEKASAAAKAAEEKRVADEQAKLAARNAEIRKAAEAKRAADAKRAAELAAAAEKTKKPLYTPPKEEDAAKAAKEEKKEVAVVLPPKAPDEPKKKEGPEPVFKSAKTEPIAFGSRPTQYNKALFDKRLKKLPGKKSGFKKKVVIALRHYGLGLLKSGECSGIAKGGPSAVPGMLYVACTDDPTYLRQFPLVEESW